MCVLLLLETRKDGKNRVFFYPHHPLPKTQKLGLDWAPHRGFINCNKWRQNASSCPWWREWICSWDFTEGRLTGPLTGHTALSFLNSRADDIIFLQRNLSGAKEFLQILQILKCSLTAACMWHSWKLFLTYLFLCVLMCVHAHNILKGDKSPHLDWLMMAWIHHIKDFCTSVVIFWLQILKTLFLSDKLLVRFKKNCHFFLKLTWLPQ